MMVSGPPPMCTPEPSIARPCPPDQMRNLLRKSVQKMAERVATRVIARSPGFHILFQPPFKSREISNLKSLSAAISPIKCDCALFVALGRKEPVTQKKYLLCRQRSDGCELVGGNAADNGCPDNARGDLFLVELLVVYLMGRSPVLVQFGNYSFDHRFRTCQCMLSASPGKLWRLRDGSPAYPWR